LSIVLRSMMLFVGLVAPRLGFAATPIEKDRARPGSATTGRALERRKLTFLLLYPALLHDACPHCDYDGLMSARKHCSSSLREQEAKFGTQLPVRRAVWSNHVVIAGDIRAHVLVNELEHSTNAAANRYGPLLIRWS
jgi:hypothetical protein